MRGAGVSTCAGETTKNIFPRKDNSSHFIYGNRGEESGGGKGKEASEHRVSRDWARMMWREECGFPKLIYSWPMQAMATRGKCMVGWRPLDPHGARSHDCVCGVATHRECARELTLRCAAEVTDVWIPVQVCHTFQTRDFLPFLLLKCQLDANSTFRWALLKM